DVGPLAVLLGAEGGCRSLAVRAGIPRRDRTLHGGGGEPVHPGPASRRPVRTPRPDRFRRSSQAPARVAQGDLAGRNDRPLRLAPTAGPSLSPELPLGPSDEVVAGLP